MNMAQPNEMAANGSNQHNFKPELQEGVKVVPGSAENFTNLQTNFVPSAGPQSAGGDLNQKPVLRRIDSRGAFPQRPPGPYVNQPQPGIPLQGNINRPPQPRPQIPPGSQFTPRPPVNQPRFPNQNSTQRYVSPENLTQNNSSVNPDFSKRPINAIPENQQFQKPLISQRPPQPGSNQPGTRTPGIVTQRSIPNSLSQPPLQGAGSFNQFLRKDSTLDLGENNLSHNDQDGSIKETNVSQTRNQTKDFIQTDTNEKQNSNNEHRPLNSMHPIQNTEKDNNMSTANEKVLDHEGVPKIPDPRVNKNQNLDYGMRKAEEDDDDSVIVPSRVKSASKSGSVTGSTDNLLQKTVELGQKPQNVNNLSEKESADVFKQNGMQGCIIDNKSTLPKEQENLPQLNRISSKSSLISEEKSQISPQFTNSKVTVTADTDLQKSQTGNNSGTTVDLIKPEMESVHSPEKAEKPKTLTPTLGKRSPGSASNKRNHLVNDTHDVKEKNLKSPKSTKKNMLPPSRPKTPQKGNKMEIKVKSPRTEMNNLINKRMSSARSHLSEGDNDSGVDESTQGNEQSCNSDNNSPKKTQKSSPKSVVAPKSKTPTKSLNSPKSPDNANAIPSATDKKKVPMNKVHVGSAPSPNIKTVKSKIGSLENATHKPGGGHIKIETKKLDFTKTSPRIAAKNDTYTPTGGDKKIVQQKLHWNVKSKIGSLDNAAYKPKSSEKKIESIKLDFKEKAKSKVGSKDNIKYVPGGGDIKIDTKKLDIKAQSKVGSLDNVKYKPGGGDVKIFDDKDYLKQRAASSADHSALSGSQNSLRSQQSQPEPAEPISDENLNQER